MRYSDIPAWQALATIDESLLLAALLLRSILLSRATHGTQPPADRLPSAITKSTTGSYATR